MRLAFVRMLCACALCTFALGSDASDELDVLSEEDAIKAGLTDGKKSLSDKEKMEEEMRKKGARPGIDKVMTVEDLMASMQGGGQSSSEEVPPEPVPWEEITGSVTVIRPTGEEEVEGGVVDVELNINTNTIETDQFEKKFNESSMCISLDDSAFSCWPIFRLSRYPRFSSVKPGKHRIRAMLTDPETGGLIESSEGIMNFTTIPKNATKDELKRKGENAQEDTNSTNSTEAPETVQIPSVDIDYPAEGTAVGSSFEARLSILTTENITKFKRLFGNGYMCLSLDEAAHTCWPIFEERYFLDFWD